MLVVPMSMPMLFMGGSFAADEFRWTVMDILQRNVRNEKGKDERY